jgi:hypothetical protein
MQSTIQALPVSDLPDACRHFGADLAAALTRDDPALRPDPQAATRVRVRNGEGDWVSLDLTPVAAMPQKADAEVYFAGIEHRNELLAAYRAARHDSDIAEAEQVPHMHLGARGFLERIVENARTELTDNDARVLAQWLERLDLYCAVKALESLLVSRADRALFELAREKGWDVHFDHLATRCGPPGDAQRMARWLCERHDYVVAQVPGEDRYLFPDGWRAYPLYKVLDNGQVLRLFIDESEPDHPEQIIRHWNRVYGYTAHHLAVRASRVPEGAREAVPLAEITAALAARGIETLTPTGDYTRGLLEQVFAKPMRVADVPAEIRSELAGFGAGLGEAIENGKLIEYVARREMPPSFARTFFGLYGIEYRPRDPRCSAPVYPYFLPAQAAHVIRTSIEM